MSRGMRLKPSSCPQKFAYTTPSRSCLGSASEPRPSGSGFKAFDVHTVYCLAVLALLPGALHAQSGEVWLSAGFGYVF
jgi:hypothetical protein